MAPVLAGQQVDGAACSALQIGSTPKRSLWASPKRVISAVGAGVDARLHDLRQVHATLMLSAGTSIRVVSDRPGHWDPGFMLRTYAHVLPNAQKDETGTGLERGWAARLEAGS
ncbi:MAG: hypothetical protein FJ314_07270 [SAR202 cluster bacterium]|nr:hypothetical protein [SAR202 cluster bacterium]